MKVNTRIRKDLTVSREKLAAMVAGLLLFINFIAFSSQRFAVIYDRRSLVFNASLILAILLLELTKLKRADGLFILAVLGFLVLEMTAGETSPGSALAILFVVSVITVFQYVKLEKGFWRVLLFAGGIAFLYIILHARNYWTLFDMTDRGLLTEGRIAINPNTLSVFLMVFYIVLCLMAEKRGINRRLLWPVRIGILALNYLLKCRTGMMIFLVIIICDLLIPYRLWLSRRFALWCYSVVLFFGIGFPRIFCILSENEWVNYMVYSLTGKFLFTGRERIWLNFYQYVDSRPMAYWFGVGTKRVAEIIGNSSIHNSYLWIMSNCGMAGVLILFAFILWTVNRAYRRGIGRLSAICVWGYLVVLLNFYTEATFGYGFTAVILNMILGMTNNDSLKMQEKTWIRQK